MKTIYITAVALSLITLTACSHRHYSYNSKMPPGQVKKMTGAKSAKAYAPGQQNKKNK